MFFFWQNNHIVVREYEIKSPLVPESFSNYRILQVTDLHSKQFGENQKFLIKKIKSTEPDLILLTGDFIDHNKNKEQPCLDLVSEIKDLAPIYFVTGNHEAWSTKVENLERELKNLGVTILHNQEDILSSNSSNIKVLGIDDPEFIGEENFLEELNNLALKGSENFTILLSHRPEFFNLYVENDIDLVFAGHAHGGQIRIPFVGGIYAPNQGFFPEYTKGIYEERNTRMVVSSGLGNSVFPQRIFNFPEIVVVTISN
jgi:hypothetical protein